MNNDSSSGARLPAAAGDSGESGTPSRGGAEHLSAEARERQSAFARGGSTLAPSAAELCAPELPNLRADLLFSLVSENVRDYAIFLMDDQGVVQCWGESARLMKWWTRQQAEGSHLRFLYPDGGSEDGTAESHIEAAADTGEYNGEGHRVRSDGSTFWAYVTLTALRNHEGVLVGFAKVTRDFSARRAVEAALARQRPVAADAQHLLEEITRTRRLVATLSHELRTPLTAILGSIALVELQIGQGDRAHIDRLQRNSRHLLAILDDVLQISQAESGQLALSPASRRLGPAIEEALADVETQAQARNLTLTNAVSGAATDLPYWGDEGRVRQILVNLLMNAVKFTEPEGRITISGGTGDNVVGAQLSGDGPWIYVRVEDTGRGIPAERLETIFEPFQQSETSDQHQGTGLGLSISRQLARLMGGDLTAHSETGAGSRFTLWLPIAPTEPVPR